MKYISSLKLQDNTIAPESSDDSVFDDYAEGASRLFDLLCEVDDNFFAPAGSSATEETLFGSGVDMMRLPPFVAGSIESVTIDGDALDAADYRVKDEFLIYKDGTEFDVDSDIVVTAKWGFASVPAAVQTVVQELANYLWRNKDPMFAKISDVEIETALSPTTNAIIKKFRDKYSRSAF